jgi:RHS repeat-associated protein
LSLTGHGSHGVAPSYRALAPHGAGLPSGIEGCHSDVPQPTAHYSLLTANSSYTFSAKEKDFETGLSHFGSRYYSSDLSIWLSVDPQSDKYPSLSPYTYCADNPVKLVDPNGETWDTPEDERKANELISKAEEQISQYKEQIQRCYARYDRFKNPQKKNDELKKIDFLNVLIDEVQKGIDGLNQMCEDECYYHFVEIGRGRNCYSKKEVRGPNDVHIIIYSDDLIETRWHECKHIQDWLNKVFPREEHDFGKDNTLGNSNEDVETSAYRSEFAFSLRRFDGQCLIKQRSINDIQGDQRVKKR